MDGLSRRVQCVVRGPTRRCCSLHFSRLIAPSQHCSTESKQREQRSSMQLHLCTSPLSCSPYAPLLGSSLRVWQRRIHAPLLPSLSLLSLPTLLLECQHAVRAAAECSARRLACFVREELPFLHLAAAPSRTSASFRGARKPPASSCIRSAVSFLLNIEISFPATACGACVGAGKPSVPASDGPPSPAAGRFLAAPCAPRQGGTRAHGIPSMQEPIPCRSIGLRPPSHLDVLRSSFLGGGPNAGRNQQRSSPCRIWQRRSSADASRIIAVGPNPALAQRLADCDAAGPLPRAEGSLRHSAGSLTPR